MKRLVSQMALTLALVTMLTFLIGGGTASAQTIHRANTTAVSVAAACPATVQEGSSGSAVVTLQKALNGLLDKTSDPSFYEMSPDTFHFPLATDGSFGPQTLSAVIDFQTWNSPQFGGTLVVDGIVGPNTWHVLHKC